MTNAVRRVTLALRNLLSALWALASPGSVSLLGVFSEKVVYRHDARVFSEKVVYRHDQWRCLQALHRLTPALNLLSAL